MKMKKISIAISVALLLSVIPAFAISDPQADFSWSPTTPYTGETIQFTDTSEDQTNISERIWYFGDGYSSLHKNPTHVYEEPGTYTVKLVVLWNISGTLYGDSVEHVINVLNRAPVANAGPDQVVNTKTVTFNGSASYDPDGEIVSYKWYFGDGTIGTGEVVQHTYAEDGQYTVTLNVTDNNNAHGEDTCKVVVDTASPVTTAKLNGTMGENGWYISNVTVELSVNETTTQVNSTYYRVDGGNWTKYTKSFVISEEGEHLLQFYSDDVAGNIEKINNLTVKIDKTPPSISIESPLEKKFYLFGRSILPTLRKTIIIGKITVLANASDNIGMNNVKFYVNGEETYNDTESPYEWRWGRAFGNKNLTVKAFDIAGLHSTDSMEVFILSLFQPWEDIAKGSNEATNETTKETTNEAS